MKYPLSILVLFAGCTAPQPKSLPSMDAGVSYSRSTFWELTHKTKSLVLANAIDMAVKSAKANDIEAVKLAILNLYNDMDDIEELTVRWEKSQSLLRKAQEHFDGEDKVFEDTLKEIVHQREMFLITKQREEFIRNLDQ